MTLWFLISGPLRGSLDRRKNTLVATAPADVPGHRNVNFLVRGLALLRDQCRRLHDLPRLAIAALRNVLRAPCLLHWMIAVSREAFDRGDCMARSLLHGDDAGAHRFSIEVHGARAAQPDAAAEL